MKFRSMAVAAGVLASLMLCATSEAADSLSRSGTMAVVQQPMDNGGTAECTYTVSKLPIDRVFRVYIRVTWDFDASMFLERQFYMGGETRSYTERSSGIYSISSKFTKGVLVTTVTTNWSGPVPNPGIGADRIYCAFEYRDDQGATVYVNDTSYRLSLAAPVGPY